MTATPHSPEDVSRRQILVTREFSAPRELAWEAMTSPQHVGKWWGPRGFTTETESMDLRPGGEWKHVMVAPDGTRFRNHSVYREVRKPERIVYAHTGYFPDGGTIEFESTWTFEALSPTRCRVTIWNVFPTVERFQSVAKFGVVEGAQQTLERLGEQLCPP